MSMKLTKKGARQVSIALDKVATLFQDDFEPLGISSKIAKDFAHRCDLLADYIEKQAGFTRTALTEYDPVKETGFNPEEIGIEKSGPLEMIDSDEPYMNGQFTQQENRELRYDQEDGKLGPDTVDEPQNIPAGRQSSFDVIGRQTFIAHMSNVRGQLNSTSIKLAAVEQHILAKGVAKLADTIMGIQLGVAEGSVTAAHGTKVLDAVNRVMPHIAAVNPATDTKVARMLDMVLHIAKDDDKDDKDDDKKDDGGKSFFEKMEEAKAKKKAGDDDDDTDDDDDDTDKETSKKAECDNPGEKTKSQGKGKGLAKGDGEGPIGEPKEASHGFNLFAK